MELISNDLNWTELTWWLSVWSLAQGQLTTSSLSVMAYRSQVSHGPFFGWAPSQCSATFELVWLERRGHLLLGLKWALCVLGVTCHRPSNHGQKSLALQRSDLVSAASINISWTREPTVRYTNLQTMWMREGGRERDGERERVRERRLGRFFELEVKIKCIHATWKAY